LLCEKDEEMWKDREDVEGQVRQMTVQTTGDIVDVLLIQHGEIEDGFDEVMRVELEHKAAAFDRLRGMLVTHEQGEQKVVHPVLRERSGAEGGDIAEARLEEERMADEMLAELNAMTVDDPAFDERFDTFRTAVLDHAHREQDEEMTWLRENLTDEELHLLADQLRSVQAMH